MDDKKEQEDSNMVKERPAELSVQRDLSIAEDHQMDNNKNQMGCIEQLVESCQKEDINITRRLKEAGKIIGINILDHVIIGEDKHISFKEKGIL